MKEIIISVKFLMINGNMINNMIRICIIHILLYVYTSRNVCETGII